MRFRVFCGREAGTGPTPASLCGWMRESVLRCMGNAGLDRAEEEMPGDIDGGVDQYGGENRTGFAPRPAVEEAGDGGQDHVAPVGKAHVGDVRKAKENGSGPPAGRIAVGCSRKHVLQQAAKEKFFGPGREKENAERKKREGLPLRPVRRKFDEVHALA